MQKTDKITRVLTLFYNLMKGVEVDKKSFSYEHNVHERSVDRDIEDIRLFLSEIYSGMNLVYNADKRVYSISGLRKNSFSIDEILLVMKILAGSKSLNVNEMSGLLSLVTSLMPVRETHLLDQEKKELLETYSAVEFHYPIVKMFSDINKAIRGGFFIELSYINKGIICVEVVLPLSINYMNSYFYVLCVKNEEYVTYRIDRIRSFMIIDTNNGRHNDEEKS